jgi:hypothetical protein
MKCNVVEGVIQWGLYAGMPGIFGQTLVDLLDRSEQQPEVEAARSERVSLSKL